METTLPDYERATTEPVDRERFRVDDDSKATWAMRKLRSLEAKVAENQRIAADEKARIEEWLAHVNESIESDAAYFRGLLVMYAREQREADNRKTITTPYGAIKSRQGSVTYDIFNKDEFLDWARHYLPDAIRVTEAPDKRALADLVSAVDGKVISGEGEVIPGVSARNPEITYTVEVDL